MGKKAVKKAVSLSNQGDAPAEEQARLGSTTASVLRERSKKLAKLAKKLGVCASIMERMKLESIDSVDGAAVFGRCEPQLRRWVGRVSDYLEDKYGIDPDEETDHTQQDAE